MGKKQKFGKVIYSTNPEYNYEAEKEEIPTTLKADVQNIRIWLERRGGGKKVSVLKGFKGSDADAKDLGKKLKSICGVGGTVKDGEILIQGDQRDKILTYLLSHGYKAKKSGG